MAITTNGITAEVIRDAMPPYQLSSDLLAAMFAAVPAPPPDATAAWRLERATRLIHEMAGLVPADAPQARIAAQIVIAREATDATFAWANGPGLTVDQACRLRRTAGALMNSTMALERTLARHQQRPVPFFGTVLDDAIDVPALAAGWGKPGSRRDGAGEPVCETLHCDSGGDPSPRSIRCVAQDPAKGEGEFVASEADLDVQGDAGVPADGPVPVETAEPFPAVTANSSAAVTMEGRQPSARERQGPPRPRQDTEASSGVVTRLDQGPGWTLDVVRPRTGGDGVGPRVEGDPVRPRAGGNVVRPRAGGDVVRLRAEGDAVGLRAEGDGALPRTGGDRVGLRAEGDRALPRTIGDLTGGDQAVRASPEPVA